MKSIKEITKENFQSMFNLKDILEDSVFYPASGIDASDIECLSEQYCSFVHVDYSTPINVIEPGMRYQFEGVGYDLIGFKHLTMEDLTPIGYIPKPFTLNEYEKQRLQSDFIRDRFNCINFEPFVLWAVYELNFSRTSNIEGKVNRFSLLHIGGEACATYEAIYINNKINPSAVAIINPGEGYGDNWTIFSDPNFRLYQNMLYNNINNNAAMPVTLLTNMSNRTAEYSWPDFLFNRTCFCHWLSIYLYDPMPEPPIKPERPFDPITRPSVDFNPNTYFYGSSDKNDDI